MRIESAEGAPCDRDYLVVDQELDQVRLRVPRKDLHLVAARPDPAVRQEVGSQLHVEIGETDGASQSFVDQSLHFRPKEVHWHGLRDKAVHGPMNQEQVDIVRPELLEALAQRLFRVSVLAFPQLRCQENFITRDYVL